MSKRINFAAILIGSLPACFPVFARSEDAGRSQVSMQFFGTFVHGTSHDGINQTSPDSGGAQRQRKSARMDRSLRVPLSPGADRSVCRGRGWGLTFQPINWYASTQTLAAFVYGAGADLNLTHRLFTRGPVSRLRLQQPGVRRNSEHRCRQGDASCGTFDWTRSAVLNRIT